MRSNTAKFVCLALGLVWLVTACSTVNPYTEQKQTSKLAVGARSGAMTEADRKAASASGSSNWANPVPMVART